MRKAQEKYNHITLTERIEIYRLYDKKVSLRDIAVKLGRNVATVSRELKRNRTRQQKIYQPVQAQEIAQLRSLKQRTSAPLKNQEVFMYVRTKLREEKWSPEMIAGRIRIDLPHQSICHETIYRYIYSKGRQAYLKQYLTLARKKRRKQDGRCAKKALRHSQIPGAISIEKRAQKVQNRRQVGHFETDLMEGNKQDRTVLSVEVERKTRYTQLTLLSSKHAKTKQEMLTKKLKTLQSLSMSKHLIVKSITADNGTENTRHTEIAKDLNVEMFFCHPYASHEKGTVENTIGRIRWHIPKGTPLSQYTNEQIQWLENKLNDTPRKCLNWKKPNEAFEKEDNSYKFRRFKSLQCCTSR